MRRLVIYYTQEGNHRPPISSRVWRTAVRSVYGFNSVLLSSEARSRRRPCVFQGRRSSRGPCVLSGCSSGRSGAIAPPQALEEGRGLVPGTRFPRAPEAGKATARRLGLRLEASRYTDVAKSQNSATPSDPRIRDSSSLTLRSKLPVSIRSKNPDVSIHQMMSEAF